MSFGDLYIEMVCRHIGRRPKRSDGVTEATMKKCERRLNLQLPSAMREYYLMAGRLDRLNKAHNRLYSLDELGVEDSHLWFMEENQAVVHWGISIKKISNDDPIVYQRANVDGAKWYSEKMSFSRFIVRMYDWQAGFADAPA